MNIPNIGNSILNIDKIRMAIIMVSFLNSFKF